MTPDQVYQETIVANLTREQKDDLAREWKDCEPIPPMPIGRIEPIAPFRANEDGALAIEEIVRENTSALRKNTKALKALLRQLTPQTNERQP